MLNLLTDQTGTPKSNVVARNVGVGGKWLNLKKAAEPLVKFTDNVLLATAGRFA